MHNPSWSPAKNPSRHIDCLQRLPVSMHERAYPIGLLRLGHPKVSLLSLSRMRQLLTLESVIYEFQGSAVFSNRANDLIGCTIRELGLYFKGNGNLDPNLTC